MINKPWDLSLSIEITMPGGGGGDTQIKMTGMLVGKFKLNP